MLATRLILTFVFVLGLVLLSSCDRGLSTVRPNASPLEFDGDVRGCGDFRVSRFADDDKKALGLIVEKGTLNLSVEPQSYFVASDDGLTVFIEDFGNDTYRNRAGYCYDNVEVRGTEPRRFNAKSGKVTIFISKSSSSTEFKITAILEDLRFDAPHGQPEVHIPKVEIRDVHIGWFPG